MADDAQSSTTSDAASSGILETPIFTLTIELSPSEWQVRSFEVELALSSVYTLRVEVITADIDVDPEGLVGRSCALAIARGDRSREIAGIVLAVEVASRGDDRLGLTLEIGPALALLAHRSDYRVHHGQSAPALVRERLESALGELGRGLRSEVDESAYPTLELCTQHGETDLEFIERVLAEVGIYYRFEVEDGREVLVLADESPRAPVIDHAGEGGELPVIGKRTGVVAAESIREFSRTSAVASDRAAAGQWRWRAADELPRVETHGARDSDGAADVGDLPGREVYTHDAPNPPDPEFAARKARLVLEQARAGATRGRGTADAIGMLVGRTFKAVGHAQRALDGDYLLTRVKLRGDAPEVQTHGDPEAGPRFRCEFEASPAAVAWRPPAPRRASQTGPMIAIVWGPEGDEEIQIDEDGRVPIRFPWDRGPEDRPSAWVRLAHAAAGNGMGTQSIPRRGDEVVIQFVCGDPSQPLVTGSLHNSLNRPAYSPEEKATSGYRSQSTPAGSGFCEISCDDTKGRERLLLRSARDMDVIAKGDYTRTVGGKQAMTVEEGLDHTVKLDEVITVGGSQVIDVYKDRLIFVSGERLATQVYNGEIVTTADKGNIVFKAPRGQVSVASASVAFSASKSMEVEVAEDLHLAASNIDIRAYPGVVTISAGNGVEISAGDPPAPPDMEAAAAIAAKAVPQLGAAALAKSVVKAVERATAKAAAHAPAGPKDVKIRAGEGQASVVGEKAVEVVSTGDILALKGDQGVLVKSPQNIVVTADQEISITAPVTIRLTVGGSTIKISPAGIEISGPVVTLNG